MASMNVDPRRVVKMIDPELPELGGFSRALCAHLSLLLASEFPFIS